MSIFGTMKTAVSGMNAQANRLGTVGDNIANSNTTAYKKVITAFSSFVLPSTDGVYNSGGVQTSVVNSISQQGALVSTSSTTDLAISGDGFFYVQDPTGARYYTRNGSFSIQQTADNKSTLINSAGFTLLAAPDAAAAGDPGQYQPIIVEADKLTKVASSSATMNANFDSRLKTADNPEFTSTVSFYEGNYGEKGIYTITYKKTADATGTTGSTWTAEIKTDIDLKKPAYDPEVTAGSTVDTLTIEFDPSTNKIKTITNAAGTVSNDQKIGVGGIAATGENAIEFDMTKVTELASDSFSKIAANGSASSSLQDVRVDKDGTVYAVYANGTKKSLGVVGLATFASPDELEVSTGNVYSATSGSGNATFGIPQQAGVGTIVSGSLEASNVDLANELTEMIEAQRTYTANSKVFQTGADILDVLVNLKR